MDRLDDRQIKAYFSVVSPLDKAGSFDIQGKGAFFIRRIEGCFYNVVGLPLRRLYRMLIEMGIPVFKLFLAGICLASGSVFLSGCATEYNLVTDQEEKYYYSTDKEITIGLSMARQIEKEYKLAGDPLMQERVRAIGGRVVAVSDRKDIDYSFKVLDDEEVNAVSLPGGFVYVNKGLIELVSSDDQLAAVIAHEVGHIVARHSIKKLQALMGYQFFRLATIPVDNSGGLTATADMAFTELLLGYGREDELLADRLGTRYAKAAGYQPHGMIEFLEKMQETNRRKPLRPKSYFKTHPYVPDRIRVVKQELGEPIEFSDYINIEEKKGE
jgi:predicted Zn-dependent protease